MLPKYPDVCALAFNEAKSIVKAGFTWGKHAVFDQKNLAMPAKGYDQIFQHYKEGVHSSREHYQQSALHFESERMLNAFENHLYCIYKFSLGNCLEIAKVALYSCLKQGCFAEIFHLTNGDHAFVVVGRKRDSDPSDSKTWGPDAIVCDPWDDRCYPASQLHDYFENNILKGYKLALYSKFNTDFLEKKRTIENLKKDFFLHVQKISKSIQDIVVFYQDFVVYRSVYIEEIFSELSSPEVIFEKMYIERKSKGEDSFFDFYSMLRQDALEYIKSKNNQIHLILQCYSSQNSPSIYMKNEVKIHSVCSRSLMFPSIHMVYLIFMLLHDEISRLNKLLKIKNKEIFLPTTKNENIDYIYNAHVQCLLP